MPKPCNTVFLQEVDESINVDDCDNITPDDKARAARVGRRSAKAAARKECPPECPEAEFVRDNHVISRSCVDGVYSFTYGGWFKCVPAKKKRKTPRKAKKAARKSARARSARRGSRKARKQVARRR